MCHTRARELGLFSAEFTNESGANQGAGAVVALGWCRGERDGDKVGQVDHMERGVGIVALTLISSAFQPDGEIPQQYTCDGGDTSPPLAWSGVPANARSLVLIVDDPDAPDPKAPRTIWVHWLLYNLPPASSGLAAAIAPDRLPSGTLQGINDWKRTGYGGPCPPIGRHRYFHKLYALDAMLPNLAEPTKAELERALKDHVLAEAQLIGTYAHRA